MTMMVEKVANAIAVADLNASAKSLPNVPMETMAEYVRLAVEDGHYQAMARAAIEGLRNPSREVLKAGKNASILDQIYLTAEEADAIWRGMIDAVLSEDSSKTSTSGTGGGE